MLSGLRLISFDSINEMTPSVPKENLRTSWHTLTISVLNLNINANGFTLSIWTAEVTSKAVNFSSPSES